MSKDAPAYGRRIGVNECDSLLKSIGTMRDIGNICSNRFASQYIYIIGLSLIDFPFCAAPLANTLICL